jgi:hypothetical protein
VNIRPQFAGADLEHATTDPGAISLSANMSVQSAAAMTSPPGGAAAPPARHNRPGQQMMGHAAAEVGSRRRFDLAGCNLQVLPRSRSSLPGW